MTHSPAQVLATFLTADTDALFTLPSAKLEWPLFVSVMPDDVSLLKVGAVYDTTGRLLKRVISTGEEWWAFGIQIKVRAMDYNEAFAMCEAVSDILAALHNATVAKGSSTYNLEVFNTTSRSLSLGQDEQRRSLFSTNGLIMMSQTS